MFFLIYGISSDDICIFDIVGSLISTGIVFDGYMNYKYKNKSFFVSEICILFANLIPKKTSQCVSITFYKSDI